VSTAVTTQRAVSSPVPLVSPPLHRITADEFERIIAAGALEDPGRVELIDGHMVDKVAKTAEHGYATKQVVKALASRLPSGWTWRQEQPVRIPAYDEPEPDVAIVQGSDVDYEHQIPTAAQAAPLVEVSGATLGQDRGQKRSAYARDGVPVHWIVNLVDRQIEVHSRPGKAGYKSRKVYPAGQHVPVAIGGQSLPPIAVDDLLPSPRPSSGRGRIGGKGLGQSPRPRRGPRRPRGN